MKYICTGDAERESGLSVPVVTVIGVRTVERLDSLRGAGGVIIQVETRHDPAEVLVSREAAPGSCETYPQSIRRTPGQLNTDFEATFLNSAAATQYEVFSNQTVTHSKARVRGLQQ